MPRLVEAQDQYGLDGLVIVGVTDADEARVREYVEEYPLNFPVLADAQELREALGVRFVWGSVIYLVDFDGLVLEEGLDDCLERLALEVSES